MIQREMVSATNYGGENTRKRKTNKSMNVESYKREKVVTTDERRSPGQSEVEKTCLTGRFAKEDDDVHKSDRSVNN